MIKDIILLIVGFIAGVGSVKLLFLFLKEDEERERERWLKKFMK